MKKATIALAIVFAVIAGLVALAWTPDRSVESLEARWAPAPSTFVTVDGVSVHLRDQGPRDDPHPIVLIHGTASSLHTWEEWVTALKRQHRVVSLDLPGTGLSGQFADDDYQIEHYARFIQDLLNQLAIEHAILVGSSLGGRIAWETAIAAPELVSRLVLIDSIGYPDAGESPPVVFRLAQIPVFRSLIEHITPRSFVKRNLVQAYGDSSKLHSDVVDRYYELFLRAGNRRAFLLQFEQEPDADFSDRIKTIAVPTLILWGELDHVVPVAAAERFHHDIVNSQLVVFGELGHVPQEEAPAQTLTALEDFLAA